MESAFSFFFGINKLNVKLTKGRRMKKWMKNLNVSSIAL
jgi:hypothetical protein